jgi:hypothetical protein
MKVFLVEIPGSEEHCIGYDEDYAKVVVAETPERAEQLARGSGEESAIFSKSQLSVKEILLNSECIVLTANTGS